jgi:hypothetical protein
MQKNIPLLILLTFIFSLTILFGSDAKYQVSRPEMEFKIFQFPHDAIPRIDGETSDWDMVPDSYVYDTSFLNDTEDGHGTDIDRKDLDVKVTLGWVKGLNRIYVRYEAYDDYWDFGRFNPKGYLNDIFEIVVDGDMSGGPFIFNSLVETSWSQDPTSPNTVENYTRFAGNHAQNYHIYTPPVNNAWVLVWGGQPWISEFPYSNVAYDYDFKHGESGKLTMECWITPYDHAPFEGHERAVESQLVENQLIGFSWSILDFDGDKRDGHYNLAHNVNMVKDASYLCAFRLMPIEQALQPDLYAEWSFQVIDMAAGKVAFLDESVGKVDAWKWDFGDGKTSTEKNPIHVFTDKNIRRVITLEVSGPKGSSKRTRYWEVLLK